MNEDDEYSLHHEFSNSITEADDKCIRLIFDYISNCGNPFKTEGSYPITNIVTNAQLDAESNAFLLQCLTMGEAACDGFYKSRLEDKTAKLFDTIPKTRKSKRSTANAPKLDIKKETVSFMRYIDYARLRNYDIKNLLQYELTTTSFSLTKEGYLRKPQKSDLSTELKRLLSGRCLESLPAVVDKRMLIIDFMAYARKVPVKKPS